MQTKLFTPMVIAALVASVGVMLASRVLAQTFTVLHNFAGYPSDGAGPLAALALSGSTLYGTDNGTMFAVNTDGRDFTNLHAFTAADANGLNHDGASPYAGLLLSGSILYGTANDGGSSGNGTMFAINADGTGFTNLHDFTGGSDGARPPQGGLFLLGNILYGTAIYGGSAGNGTVFEMNTDGTGFRNLHSFTAASGSFPNDTNSDGVYPEAGVILSGNTLYGTAGRGGSAGHGTVFAINSDGTGFTNLHSFTGSDGAFPHGLILSGNILYGAAEGGGSSGSGTVFKVNTNGTGFTNLYSFTAAPAGTNSDGTAPSAGLILSGNALYGTAQYGGSSQWGTVFAVKTDGTGFTTLHSFATTTGSGPYTNGDGAEPWAALILSHNILYGTTYRGGSSGCGTVFSLTLPTVNAPQLTIIRSGANVILTWPTNSAGFTLQSTTNLIPAAVWSTVSPAPVVVNGLNAVTNVISGTRKFYRLSQ
jgi:uncharacterized repeat protein (TIGR03803 family)